MKNAFQSPKVSFWRSRSWPASKLHNPRHWAASHLCCRLQTCVWKLGYAKHLASSYWKKCQSNLSVCHLSSVYLSSVCLSVSHLSIHLSICFSRQTHTVAEASCDFMAVLPFVPRCLCKIQIPTSSACRSLLSQTRFQIAKTQGRGGQAERLLRQEHWLFPVIFSTLWVPEIQPENDWFLASAEEGSGLFSSSPSWSSENLTLE